MTNPDRIRIVAIGAGKQAQCAHLPHYSILPGCELVAVVDRDPELAERVAQRFGVPAWYSTHQEALEKAQPDAFLVTLPPIPSAERLVCELLHTGVPVMMEKPLAGSPTAARRICEEVRKTGTLLRVGFHKRSDPATIAAKEEILRLRQTGELGSMTYVRIQVSLSGNWIANAYRYALTSAAPFTPETFPLADMEGIEERDLERFEMFVSGNGHQFDLMRHLLGESFKIDYVDPTGVLLAVRSESGVPAVFEFTPFNSTRDWVEYAEVCFERGYVRIDLPAPLAMHTPGRVEFFRDEGPDGTAVRTVPVFPRIGATQRQAMYFLDALRGEETPLCDADQAAESVMIAAEWTRRLRA